MKKADIGDTTYRNALLKACLDRGMSTNAILEISVLMRGKTNEEKEQIAKNVLKDMGER